jgi:RNA 2',3'-cyclic 3'-phosphodiesterase
MRAFFAIELPDDVRDELARAQERLKAAIGEGPIGWTQPASWHVTLAFLGDAVEDAAKVAEAARPIVAAAGPFELTLASIGAFGGRVLWAGLEGPGAAPLVDLVKGVQQALAPLGFAADDRPFSPHITLARVRDDGRGRRKGKGRRDDIARAVREVERPRPLSFTAREVVLFESRLAPPKPATYVPLARLPARSA